MWSRRGFRAFTTTSRSIAGLQSTRIDLAGETSLHALAPASKSDRHAILCLPSAFGSAATDFAPQLEELSMDYDMIAIDPRGYGDSRPPERSFSDNFLERDADDAAQVMQSLGYNQFSVLGWSAGANVAAILAGKYPDLVSRLVLVNGNAFVAEEDLEAMEEYENPSQWAADSRRRREQIYGEDQLRSGWFELLSVMRGIYDKDGDLCCGWLPQIHCKTLVVKGEDDDNIAEYHSEYLSERILHSRLHIVPEGHHDLHLSQSHDFHKVLREFLEEPDDKMTQSREYVAIPSKK